ncbi:DUF1292 domain-containing protein [Nitrosomonas sp. HPC101]|uniref:DUF1292 domain-containing protein n=1 Tax=Nitrosomonas sp. HPC101 TaxID=1658667 RepID=UPI001367AB3D|nr:DUF1292 domain-containing protein [Nitrosomonas sp. HPC101]MXS85903.1 DUF1292 domain-containing protein [Nitrosomonas sp. HPC101]
MNRILVSVVLLMATGFVFGMKIDPDPRVVVSFMDKSISPELDILRVTADISPDNSHLVFQVKTRGERAQGDNSDYLLLHIMHGKAYVLLLPVNKDQDSPMLVYERLPQTGNNDESPVLGKFRKNAHLTDFDTAPVFRGGEFSVSLDWIDFNTHFRFDAYTVQARVKGDTLEIQKIYDQARKGKVHRNEKPLSAIALLNKICTPRSNDQRL